MAFQLRRAGGKVRLLSKKAAGTAVLRVNLQYMLESVKLSLTSVAWVELPWAKQGEGVEANGAVVGDGVVPVDSYAADVVDAQVGVLGTRATRAVHHGIAALVTDTSSLPNGRWRWSPSWHP